MDAGYAGNARDAVKQQLAVGIHVLHHGFQLVIGGLSGDQQAFDNLRYVTDLAFKCAESFFGVLVHGNVDQGGQVESQHARIQTGMISGDETGLFQLAQSTQAGGSRKADAFCQFLIGQPAIGLQQGEDFSIIAVNIHFLIKKCQFYGWIGIIHNF